MGYTIAVCGKGGSGKTTFTALIIRWLLEQHKAGAILAVDADPNSTLDEALGVKAENSIVAIMDDIAKNPSKVAAGMTKDRFLEYRIQESLIEADGFDLLVMGRPEGPGCYCYANNLLRTLISRLTEAYSYIIIDNEAGMEHLSRRTARRIDLLFVISDYSMVGLRSAKRILALTKELEITVKAARLVINRSPGGNIGSLKKEIDNIDAPLAGVIPEDEDVIRMSIKGDSIKSLANDSFAVAAVSAICEVAEKLLKYHSDL